ncbi:signal transduction histidine kinase [Paraburkholderia eburnea]|uniref:histidine kinase n=1 Tax=Paraburkholderia eburnea TaxID=1189126 RepID=A0A2S4M6I2_9BURK|nr:sensor histidine kinase [Paraburkholderia eburnea]POR50189.1 signal transduction histidine kinase [Paraburkholderia eburnea]PRZ20530.1 signal transduction histidine kinase [Paraburkholderia eburnea]
MYSILPAFVSALFLGFGVYVLLTEGVSRLSVPFALMCATTFVWQGTWAFLFQTADTELADILVKFGYLFILFLPTTYYHFNIEVSARRGERPFLLASYGLSVVLAMLLIVSDEVVAGYGTFFFGKYPHAGLLHPVHVAQTVLLALRSGWLLFVARGQTQAHDRRRLLDLCLLSLAIYGVAASDYAVNYGVAFYPVGAVFIAVSLGILAVTIVRYGLMRPYLIAATVAHEVATPLAAIGMHAEEIGNVLPELMRGYQLAVQHQLCVDGLYPGQSERLSSLATSIRRQVDSTSTVVEMSLASFTLDRLDRRSFEAYPIRSCVNAALERFPFRAGERELVRVQPIDPQRCFSGSDSLVVFVLFNLLKNALYAIHAGGGGRVEIDTASEGGYCVLRFTDTGPGISAEVLPRIFEPFYSTKSHGKGSGMGLAFCRRVADALGGAIDCESVPDVATTFTLYLPEPGSAADRALHDGPGKPRRWTAGQDYAG